MANIKNAKIASRRIVLYRYTILEEGRAYELLIFRIHTTNAYDCELIDSVFQNIQLLISGVG